VERGWGDFGDGEKGGIARGDARMSVGHKKKAKKIKEEAQGASPANDWRRGGYQLFEERTGNF